MHKISATIITRNEEHNIERCLEALRDVADEIVVVDSYSTDRTVEICRRYGCRVTAREFRGFGSQRQYAAGLTRFSYVLSIDADETLDEALRQSILELKRTGFDHRVYSVMVKTYFCGRLMAHSGFEPEQRVRLFNKRYANWNLRDVSDEVSYSDSLMPVVLEGAIHHYRSATLDEFVRKENRIAALQANVLANSDRALTPLSPWLYGVWEYLRCYVMLGGFLDGRHGLTIARRRAATVRSAYRMARRLRQEKSLARG